MTTGLGQNCVTRGRGPLEIPFCKPQIGAKTETWLENSWRRSDNIVGDLEENYAITFHAIPAPDHAGPTRETAAEPAGTCPEFAPPAGRDQAGLDGVPQELVRT